MNKQVKAETEQETVGGPPTLPNRKQPVHLTNIDRHNQPTILFVTVCTKSRKAVLANHDVHSTLLTVWNQACQYRVGRYIIMPDHIHLFCSPAVREPENVSKWVAYWKRLASSQLKSVLPLWQRGCWDTQLRNSTLYTEKWNYVSANPIRKGLVEIADDWPWQGCLNELRW